MLYTGVSDQIKSTTPSATEATSTTNAAAADGAAGAPAPPDGAADAHSCTSRVWSVRIRRIAIGISTGSADSTAATPSDGRAASKA